MFSYIKKELIDLLMEYHIKSLKQETQNKENEYGLRQTKIIMEWAILTNGNFQENSGSK